MEKIFTTFNNIPNQVLCKFPDYNPETYQRLRILHENVKAKIRQADQKLLSFDQADCRVISINDQNLPDSSDTVSSSCSKHSPEDNKFQNPIIDLIKINQNNEKANSIKRQLINGSNLFKSASDIEINTNNSLKPMMSSTITKSLSCIPQDKINSFSLKKPVMTNLTGQSINEPRSLLNTTYSNINNWNNESIARIRNLPSSTITSNSKNLISNNSNKLDYNDNKIENNKYNTDHITNKIQNNNNHTDFFSRSVMWNDSEGFV